MKKLYARLMERYIWLKIYNILLSNGYLMNDSREKPLELEYDKMTLSYPLGDKERVANKASHTLARTCARTHREE